jgi:DNA-binding NarL/FixJ family response regulator
MPERLNFSAGVRPDREVKVLVVDDNEAFLCALRDLVAAAPGFALAGVACSGEDAIRAVDELAAELVLMDVVMPGMGGIAAARKILSNSPGVVVVLTSVDDPALISGAAELGSAVRCERKQDLRPCLLQQLWAIHRN